MLAYLSWPPNAIEEGNTNYEAQNFFYIFDILFIAWINILVALHISTVKFMM